MSAGWNELIDKNLIAIGAAQRAFIVSLDGTVLGASPQGSNLQRAEVQEILTFWNDPSAPMAKGIVAQGAKFMCLRSTKSIVYGKNGAEGVVICKANNSFICAICDLEKVDVLIAGEAVEKLADYLADNGC